MSSDHSTAAANSALLPGVVFAAIWSLSFVATKSALEDWPPLWLASVRLALATVGLMIFQAPAVLHYLFALRRGPLCRIFLAGILAQSTYLGVSYWALVHVPTSIVNIVVSSLPLVTLPLAFLVLGERIGIGTWECFDQAAYFGEIPVTDLCCSVLSRRSRAPCHGGDF